MSTPEYDPWALVSATATLLNRAGLPATMHGEQINEALTAAEDLLRALNITPVVPDYDAEGGDDQ
jgi:anthranilate phosphoribosyltransferase